MFLKRLRWLALFISAVLYGQQNLATVTGLVTDHTTAVVAGVVVVVRSTDTNIAHSNATNQNGYFTVTELPPGPYEISETKDGFDAYRESKLILETGQQLRNDIQLKIGSVAGHSMWRRSRLR